MPPQSRNGARESFFPSAGEKESDDEGNDLRRSESQRNNIGVRYCITPSEEYTPRASPQDRRARPFAVSAVVSASAAVALSMLLAAGKMLSVPGLAWWVVLAPVFLVLLGVLAALTAGIVVWFVQVCRSCGPEENFDDYQTQPRLDVILRTFKICFLGHNYASLLCLSWALVMLRVDHWRHLSVLQVVLPVIILGVVHVAVAVVFKQPEVDPGWSGLLGVVMIFQPLMIAVKIDYLWTEPRLRWVSVFWPSWLAYVLLFVHCVGRGVTCTQELLQADAAEPGGPRGGAEERLRAVGAGGADKRSLARERDRLWALVGAACGAAGFASSQVILALHLDGVSSRLWPYVILPSFIGWFTFSILVTRPLSDYLVSICQQLFNPWFLDDDSTSACGRDTDLLLPWH